MDLTNPRGLVVDRLAAMEAFVRVIDGGSFSSAAKQLHVGQSAVSKTIAQLEDRLGVRLLLRSTHGLTLTEAGRSFYEGAKRAIEEAEEAELVARGAASTLSGRLRVLVAVTFGRLHLMPHLPSFLAEYPALDIDIVLQDGDIDLVGAGIDVALRMSPLRDLAPIGRKIGHCRRRIGGTPAYFTANGVPHTPAELASYQAIVYEQRLGGPTWSFWKANAESTVTMTGRVHVTAAEGVREAVIAGLGFAIASEWMFTPELKSGSVISVLDDWSLPNVELWAVYPTGRQVTAKARAFASFVEQRVSGRALVQIA
ncbi:MAG TPA: LysR family transcriptional regulator [Acetobacteraceae bacterium]|nr:LysR family transcriptional regulator [Acetobacteraceae bacterium]